MLVFLRHLGLQFIAGVQVNSVAERDAFTVGNRQVSSQLVRQALEIVPAKWIRGKQGWFEWKELLQTLKEDKPDEKKPVADGSSGKDEDRQ